MSQKNKLTVILNGREYTLVSEQTAEYMQKVALCVDRKMQEVSSMASSQKLSTAMLAMLTSLNLAEDYINTRDDLDKTTEQKMVFEDQCGKKQKQIEVLSHKEKELTARIGELQEKLVKLQTFLKAKGIDYLEK